MKKALVVLLVMTCLAAAAFADMAPTALSVSGEITYGMTISSASTSDGFANQNINFGLTVDPNNKAVFGLVTGLPVLATGPGAVSTANLAVDLFYVRSDIGGALGLSQVDPVLYAGYGVFDLPGFQITQYASERTAAIGIAKGNSDDANGIFGAAAGSAYGLVALDTKVMDVAHIVLATAGDWGVSGGGHALIGTYGTVGPVSFEAGWASVGTTSGYIPLGLQYSSTMGDIALTAMGNFTYNMNSGGKSTAGGGVKAVFQGMYTVDAAVIYYVVAAPASSNFGSNAIEITGDVMANLSPTVGIVVSPFINLDSGAKDTFDALEAFVWTTFGATKLRVGYLYSANDPSDRLVGADYAASHNNHLGGFFFTVDYNF